MKRSYGKAFKKTSKASKNRKKQKTALADKEEQNAYIYRVNQKGALTTGNITGSTLALPSTAKATFRYAYAGSLDPSTGGVALTSFRANGPYDPEVAVGGHQPRGWDQFAAFYTHYHCIGATATLYMSNTATSANQIAFGIFLNDVATPLIGSTPLDYIESPNCAWKMMAAGSGDDTSATVRQTFSASKFFGKKAILSSESHGAAINNYPSDEAYFHVWMGQPQAGADIPAQAYTMVIDYIVVFHGRSDLVAS